VDFYHKTSVETATVPKVFSIFEVASVVDTNCVNMEAENDILPVVESITSDDFGLDALIKKFSDVLEVTEIKLDSGKTVTRVKCELTEHEMPLDFDAICEHVGGATFTRRYKQYHEDWQDQAEQYADENENNSQGVNTFDSTGKLKLKGVATPNGKKQVFKSPQKTPSRVYEQYNVHWSIEEYDQSIVN
jgi:hypothetical protein